MSDSTNLELQHMTREQLVEEVQRLRWTLEANPQVRWTADADGRVVNVSKGDLNLKAPSHQDALPDTWLEATHPNDLPSVEAAWNHSIRTGGAFDVEHRVRTANDGYRWMRSRAKARIGGDGRVAAWHGTTEDIHEMRTTAETLAATADALPALVFHVDAELRYRFVNRHLENVFGKPKAEVIGKTVRELVGEKTYTAVTPYLQKALSGERAEWAMWIDFPTGRRFMHATYVPSIDSEGQVVGIDVLAADQTETMLTQEALRESESQYRQIAEGIAPIVWTTLPNGYHDFFSQRWYDYTGMERGGERGWQWKDYLHPDDYQRTLDVWHRCLETGEPYEIEYRFKRADGEYRWFLGQALAIRGEDGRIMHWFGTLTDIHDQKEAEALLEQRVAERTADLMRANRDLQAFSYSVAHDLRAPLRAIVATSRILMEDARDRLKDCELDLLQRQAKNAKRLGTIVDDMLEFARLSDSELRKVDFDMSGLAKATAAQVAERWARPAGKVSVQEGMRAVGDSNLIGYALANLLDNAFKFSPEGGPIDVGFDGTAFFVRDQGVGFDMTHAHKLFVAFERLVGQETFEGTGVGLANVKRIIERHGGSVWADSAPNQGSTFFFELPH